MQDVTDCAIPPYSDHHEEVAELVQVTMDKVEAIIKFVDENNLMDDILHEQLSVGTFARFVLLVSAVIWS